MVVKEEFWKRSLSLHAVPPVGPGFFHGLLLPDIQDTGSYVSFPLPLSCSYTLFSIYISNATPLNIPSALPQQIKLLAISIAITFDRFLSNTSRNKICMVLRIELLIQKR
jgi:hypothetical protein